MRLAVVAQQASAGGGTRFLRPLVMALAEAYPDLRIQVFMNAFAADSFGAGANFAHERVTVVPIDPRLCTTPGSELDGTPPVAAKRRPLEALGIRDVRPPVLRAASDLARAVSRCDVVYLAWPYFLHPMVITAPLVGTFHDFNYRHDFGTLGPDFRDLLDLQISYWLSRCEVAVASARFIEDEMREYYGDIVRSSQVVRLSTLLAGSPQPAGVKATLERLALPERYVICPSNTSRHKNLQRLLIAYASVRTAGGPPLVLMGNGTELLHGLSEAQTTDPTAIATLSTFVESGLRLGEDVFALGYVSDSDADCLIAGAELLVAPSLYEAGSGPALDAWALGTPVAMSAIPPFLEHMEFLGVEAATFDPLSEREIAATILETLAAPEGAAEMSDSSKTAISRYAWAEVAAGYRAAFDAAIALHRRG